MPPSLPATVAVWLGVCVILALAVGLPRDLTPATEESERAQTSGQVSEAFRVAHDANSRQEIALRVRDRQSHRAAASSRRFALFRILQLDPDARPAVAGLLDAHSVYLDAANDGLAAPRARSTSTARPSRSCRR